MCRTVQRAYRGWNITIRCSYREGGTAGIQATTFTAMAEAELEPGQDPNQWIDPRLQVLSTGNRSFNSSSGSIDVLLAEVMALIDALRK